MSLARTIAGVVAIITIACMTTTCSAQSNPLDGQPDQKADDVSPEKILPEKVLTGQRGVAERYQRLEELLRRLSDFEEAKNPRRSKLLEEAYQQSKEKFTKKQLDTVVQLLERKQYSAAIRGQQTVHKDLVDLLDLLKSEDRSERIRSDQDRIKEYIKEVERILRIEKGIRGQTEHDGDADKLAKAQQRAAERTANLDRQIGEDEGAEGEQSDQDSPNDQSSEGQQGTGRSEPSENGEQQDGNQQESEQQPNEDRGDAERPGDESEKSSPQEKDQNQQPSDQQPSDQQPSDQQPSDQQPADGQQQAQDGQPSQGQPSQGQPSQGQPSQGQPSQGQPSQGQPDEQSQPEGDQSEQQNPVRQRIQAAEQRMRDAQQKLEDAKRAESIKDMEQAEQELELAKRQLEEILRQLREEEVERMLALLEGRFRAMLERELRVAQETKNLDKIDVADRASQFDIQAGKLGIEQQKIALEANKALILLREEGSSIAFPETVEQMRDDMEQVAQRLGRSKVGPITQAIEEEIIETLNYIIEALVQAQKDMEQQQQQPNMPQQPMGNPDEQALVDALAELKLIRGLQQRVNRRHSGYAKLLAEPDDPFGFSEDPDLRDALTRLAERQQRIQRITRDLVLGKNR